MLLMLALACWGDDDVQTRTLGPKRKAAASALEVEPAAAFFAEILPIGRGDLSPAGEIDVGAGLQVGFVGPTGDQARPMQAIVVFDRPLTALTSIDEATVPLSCDSVEGLARWAGTTTAVFSPEGGHFPRSSNITCSVPAGTVATDGSSLEKALSWTFHTAPPELRRTWPREGTDQANPEDPILLVFDQPTDPEEVRVRTTIADTSGNSIQFTASRPEPESLDDVRIPKELERAVLLEATLAPNTSYQLVLAAGLPGMEGSRGTGSELELSFSTYPPPGIADHQPTGREVDPYTAIRLELATVTDAAELGAKISISPEPPDGWDPAEAYSYWTWSHGVRLEPMTEYTVKVEGGWKDSHGQEYATPLEWSFTTGHMDPMVDAASGPKLYPSTNPTELPARTRNVSELSVGVKALTVDQVIAVLGGGSNLMDSRSRKVAKPEKLFTARAKDDSIHIDRIDLAPWLERGDTLLLVETSSPSVTRYDGSAYYQKALLQVSDLGTTVKAGPSGVTTWVTRLSDGEPVAGATVTLVRGRRNIWTGVTDDDGLAVSTDVVEPGWRYWSEPIFAVVQSDGDTAITSSDNPHDLYLWDFDLSYSGSADDDRELRTFSFTDRGVYKPGDTAHVAASARLANHEGLAIVPAEANWSCSDARGAVLLDGAATVDDGHLSFDVELPEEMAMGSAGCSIEFATKDGLQGSTYASVPVHTYRAPSFRVEVSADEHGIAGDELEATGTGNFLFGAAMGGAEARWVARASEVRPRPEGWDDFTFAGDESRGWWEREYQGIETLAEGTGVLDATGAIPFSVTVPVSDEARTLEVELEVQVTDSARQRVANRAHTLVHPASFYVGLRSTTGLGRAGEGAAFEFVTVSPEGTVQAGVPVDVVISRRTWDVVRKKGMDGYWTWESEPTDEAVETATVSSEETAAKVPFTPKEAGYYVISASAKDSEGRTSKGEAGLYVAGSGASWARGDDNLVELVPDKRSYAPGDTAKLLVKAPKEGMTALITVERERILDRRVVKLATAAETVEIPLTEQAAPNVFVSVLLTESAPPADSPDAGTPSWHLGYTELEVSAEGRHLDVAIESDDSVYQPGQNVTVDVSVTRNGSPAEGAQVVLYAVDHGVLSLTAYETPDPFDRYWRSHPLNVRTADSRRQVLDRGALLVKGAPAGGGGGDSGPALRSRFETTPLWEPDLEADAEGKVRVTFTLPDDLTTFRIMAVVLHEAEGFGSAEREIQVSRPLIAQPALPRLLRVGDRARAGIVVHNNVDEDREVAVVAEAVGVELIDGTTSVTVPARGNVEVAFELQEPEPGEAVFTFDVEAGPDRDRVEVTIPIERPIPVETVATAGTSAGEVTEHITMPKGAQPGVGGLDIQISNTVLVGTDASLDYLVQYPHGCLEQTSSRLLAAILAKDLGDLAGLDRDPAELDALIDAGLARIELFEHASGGYAYWPGQKEPSVLATAHLAEVLHHAQLQGVGPGVSEETVRFLRNFMDGRWTPTWWAEETTWSARSRVALTLARIGEGDPGWNSALWDRRDKLSLTGRFELMETIGRTSGPDARTTELQGQIEGHLFVEATRAVVKDDDMARWAALFDGDMAPTAAALRALMVVEPEHALVPKLANGIVAGRNQGRWGNTYTTLRSFQALSAYAEVYEGDPARAVSVRIGALLLEEELTPGEWLQHEVPIDRIDSKDVTIQPLDGRAYYELRLAYGMDEMPPRDAGFTVTRTMTIIEGAGVADQVDPGALVEIELRVSTPIDRTYVAVVSPLPAGLEPVDTFFATSASSLGDGELQDTGYGYYGYYGGWYDTGWSDESPTWSDWVFVHRELRDDQVMLYADWMPAGVHTYSYVARATTPGEYSYPAATAEEMYRPENFGRTEQGRFTVGEAPLAQSQ